MKKAKLIIIAVICILALIIFFQNRQAMETRILFLTVTMSRALFLLLMFGLGFITGLITSIKLKKTDKPKV
jgi:hypothetical protein